MRRRLSHYLLSLWLLCSVAGASESDAASEGESQPPLDCTIEPRTIARIGSSVEGIIEQINVRRGDLVTQDQVLAQLDSRREQLMVELARLQAKQDTEIRSQQTRLGFQRLEKERAEKLFERQILSDKLLDEAKVQETIARLDLESAAVRHEVAKVELALAEESLDQRTIRSSIDAVVTEVSKAPGEYIHEQATLLTLARIDELNVEVFVPVLRYGQIQPNQQAIVEPVQPIGGHYTAVVEVVDRVFDAASNTFGVRLLLPNPEGKLPAGIRCTVRFLSTPNVTE